MTFAVSSAGNLSPAELHQGDGSCCRGARSTSTDHDLRECPGCHDRRMVAGGGLCANCTDDPRPGGGGSSPECTCGCGCFGPATWLGFDVFDHTCRPCAQKGAIE